MPVDLEAQGNSNVMNIEEIIIQDSFKHTLPLAYKIKRCYAFFRKYHAFDRLIVINERKELVDGYVAYLVAKMLDIKMVPFVVVSDNELQKALTK